MKRVLLLNPPSEKGYIRSGRWTRKSRGNQQWYPIWLGYTTALLEREGFSTWLLDACAEGLTDAETITKISSYQPDIIVYYFTYDTLKKDVAFAEALSDKPLYEYLVLASPWSYCVPNLLKTNNTLNLMTYGEFEYTILEIAQEKHPSNIRGLIWRNEENEIEINDRRPLVSPQELDKIPFVTKAYFNNLNIRNYRQTSFRYPYIDLLGARGCPHRCTYCVWTKALQGGSSYRPRSIKNVISELQWIKTFHPEIKQVFFQDDTLPEARMKDLSQAIIDADLKITWGGYSRAEVSREALTLFKQSGGRTLHVGYEIPIQARLDEIQKDITVTQMEEFAKNIKDLNLWTSATFMILPWETPEEIQQTIKWCKHINPTRMNLIQTQAYPNTPYESKLKEKGNLCMTSEEMNKWEKKGFTEFYIKNPSFWLRVLKNPKEWANVYRDAKGLMGFLFE